MERDARRMHLIAGAVYGRGHTCHNGQKVDYKSEASAVKAAAKMKAKSNRDLEAYPCFWCSGWHIGREMTQEEYIYFMDLV